MEAKYLEAIAHWCAMDVKTVLTWRHTLGRQAEIRARLINKMGISKAKKICLYRLYSEQLMELVNSVPGLKIYGTMPVPRFD